MSFSYPFLKICVAVCSSVLALLVSLVFIETDLAITLVKFVGKRYMLAVSLFFLYALIGSLSPLAKKNFTKSLSCHFPAIIVIIISTLYLHLHFDQGFKILFDEHALSSTAMSMHFDQTAYVQTASILTQNETIDNVGFVDKRPILFPFLISLVHLAFGFHPENVFWLNSFLTFLLLCLLYAIVCQVCDKRSGIFAVLLLTSLPLLAQNSTGGGFEIMNLCLIAMLLLCGFNYMKQPGTGGLNLVILVTILLANNRYESIMYVVVPVVLFIVKGIKEKRFELTWLAAFSPLLLIPPLLSYSIFQADDRLKQTNEGILFSSAHLPGNLVEALAYLFDWGNKYSSSILLSILGFFGILFITIEFTPRFKRYSGNIYLTTFSIVGLVLIFNIFLALNYYWGEWTDPRVSRFSLPLQFLFAIVIPLSIRYYFKLKTISLWMFLGVLVFIFCVTSPKSKHLNRDPGLLLTAACDWAIEWINNEAKNTNNFILSDASVGFILYGHPAFPVESANETFEYIQSIEESGSYDNIFFVEGFWYDKDRKRIYGPGFAAVAPHFIREPLVQYTVNSYTLFQISRLVRLEPNEIPRSNLRGIRVK